MTRAPSKSEELPGHGRMLARGDRRVEAFLRPACWIVLEAAWLSAAGGAASRWIEPAATSGLLPLAMSIATAATGFVLGKVIRRLLGSVAAPAAAPAAVRRALPNRRAALGALGAAVAGCSLLATWAGRHAGEDLRWAAALPGRFGVAPTGADADLAALVLAGALATLGLRCGLGASVPADIWSAIARRLAATVAACLAVAAGSPGSAPDVDAATTLFFVSSVTAVTLEQAHQRQLTVAAAQPDAGYSSRLRDVLPAVAAVVLLSLVPVAVAGQSSVRDAGSQLLGSAGRLVWLALLVPLLLLGLLAQELVSVFAWLLDVLRQLALRGGHRPPAARPGMDDLRRMLQAQAPELQPRDWPAWLGPAAVAAVAIVLGGLALARLERAPRTALGGGGDDERESLWPWQRGSALSGLRRLLRRRQEPDQRAGEPSEGHSGAASHIRAAYRRVLVIGRRHGHRRRPADTPGEYAAGWRRALPAAASVQALTELYEMARYGPPEALDSLPSDGRGAALVEQISRALVRRREHDRHGSRAPET